MDAATMDPMARAFLEAARVDPDARERPEIVRRLDQAAELLPVPEVWSVVGSDEGTTLLLLTEDVLFAVTWERPAAEPPQVIATSSPARVTGVRCRRDGLRTFWNFEFRCRDPIAVYGVIDHLVRADEPEMFDQAEIFARALAHRAGWDALDAA